LEEVKSWGLTALILILATLTLYFSEIFFGKIFVPEFELAIFYFPASLAIVIYFYLKRKASKKI